MCTSRSKEGDKEHIQVLEGTVIGLRRAGQVCRTKLYYLRGLKGKAARIRAARTEQTGSCKESRDAPPDGFPPPAPGRSTCPLPRACRARYGGAVPCLPPICGDDFRHFQLAAWQEGYVPSDGY